MEKMSAKQRTAYEIIKNAGELELDEARAVGINPTTLRAMTNKGILTSTFQRNTGIFYKIA